MCDVKDFSKCEKDKICLHKNNINFHFDAVWLKALCVLLYVLFLQDDADFPENIEDFVTLDELDNTAGADSALGKYNSNSSWYLFKLLKGVIIT